MKISILSLRQKKKDPFMDIQNDYLNKISNWKVCNREIFNKKKLDKRASSEILESKLELGAYAILLDEKGVNFSSCNFAQMLEEKAIHGEKELVFIIGGAEGVTESLKRKAKKIISFGKATWPHKMVRLMLIEQIYRAQQILRGHPYHKV